MPETTVNKDYFAARDKDKVWLSWKIFAVECVAITQGVSGLSDADFGSSIPASHRAHAGAALFRRQVISHQAGPR
jgi:hypothetical protein